MAGFASGLMTGLALGAVGLAVLAAVTEAPPGTDAAPAGMVAAPDVPVGPGDALQPSEGPATPPEAELPMSAPPLAMPQPEAAAPPDEVPAVPAPSAFDLAEAAAEAEAALTGEDEADTLAADVEEVEPAAPLPAQEDASAGEALPAIDATPSDQGGDDDGVLAPETATSDNVDNSVGKNGNDLSQQNLSTINVDNVAPPETAEPERAPDTPAGEPEAATVPDAIGAPTASTETDTVPEVARILDETAEQVSDAAGEDDSDTTIIPNADAGGDDITIAENEAEPAADEEDGLSEGMPDDLGNDVAVEDEGSDATHSPEDIADSEPEAFAEAVDEAASEADDPDAEEGAEAEAGQSDDATTEADDPDAAPGPEDAMGAEAGEFEETLDQDTAAMADEPGAAPAPENAMAATAEPAADALGDRDEPGSEPAPSPDSAALLLADEGSPAAASTASVLPAQVAGWDYPAPDLSIPPGTADLFNHPRSGGQN